MSAEVGYTLCIVSFKALMVNGLVGFFVQCLIFYNIFCWMRVLLLRHALRLFRLSQWGELPSWFWWGSPRPWIYGEVTPEIQVLVNKDPELSRIAARVHRLSKLEAGLLALLVFPVLCFACGLGILYSESGHLTPP